MLPSLDLVIQCECICEQSFFARFAVVGSVAAIRKKVDACCRNPLREFIAHLFDPLGITPEIEDSVISAGTTRPASQCDSVMRHDKISVPGVDSRFLRKVQKITLPEIHPCANAEVCDYC